MIYSPEVTQENLKSLFAVYKQKWLDETRFESNTSHIVENPNYLAIIQMGAQAIPFILEDWEVSDSHWFYALRDITNHNPIKKEHQGKIKLMKEDWIVWLKNNYGE